MHPMFFACRPTFMLQVDYAHLVRHFADSGAAVTCCVARVPDGSEADTLLHGVSFSIMPIDRKLAKARRILGTLRASFRLAMAHPTGIFTLISMQVILLAGAPLRLLNRKAVFLICGMGTLFSSRKLVFRIFRPLVKQILRYFFSGQNSRVIVQNHDDLRYVTEQLGARHALVMPGCGTDPARFPYIDSLTARRPKAILVPARLIVEKGICEAAEASRILHDRGIAHEMWFSADIDIGNPMSLTRTDLARLATLAPTIRFLGFQTDMAATYSACSIVCLPSYREGLPSALVEASACGLPIVTTDVHGCREIVTDGFNGLLVPSRDPDRLADALERLLTDDNLAQFLRTNAYSRFTESYTRKSSLEAVLPAYRSLGAIC